VEEELKSKSEEEKRKWIEAQALTKKVEELRARAEADAKQRESEAMWRAEAIAAKERERAAARERKRRGIPKGPVLLLLLVALIAGPVAYIAFAPLDFLVPRARQALADRVQDDVSVGSVKLDLMPLTLTLENVTLGKGKEVRIAAIQTEPSPESLLFGVKTLETAELRGVSLPQEALSRLPKWATGGLHAIPVKRIVVRDASLALRDGPSVPFAAEIELVAGEGLRQAQVKSGDGTLSALVKPRGNEFEVALTSRGWQLPAEMPFKFDELRAVGMTGKQELQFADVEGRLYGGTLKGNARLRWGDRWSVEGNFRLKDAQAEPLARAFPGVALQGGTVDASGTVVLQGAAADEMFDAPRLDAGFVLRNGTLANLDLAQAAAAGNKEPVQGGSTAFAELGGTLSARGGQFQVRQLRLSSDALAAAGSLESVPGRGLSGRLAVEPKAAGLARVGLALSGTLKEPVLTPVK